MSVNKATAAFQLAAFFDYEGRGAPFGMDDGTLAPWAVVASLAFAPDIVLPTIHHCVHTLR